MKTFTNSTTYKNTKYECMHLITTNASWAYCYAYKILKQRWADINKPEVEDDVIGKDAECAYWYAHDVLKKRWADIGKPEVEDVIGKDVFWAYCYACYVLNKRWADINKPEVEDWMLQSEYADEYSAYFTQQGEVK